MSRRPNVSRTGVRGDSLNMNEFSGRRMTVSRRTATFRWETVTMAGDRIISLRVNHGHPVAG
jgi:hypothetical protein